MKRPLPKKLEIVITRAAPAFHKDVYGYGMCIWYKYCA